MIRFAIWIWVAVVTMATWVRAGTGQWSTAGIWTDPRGQAAAVTDPQTGLIYLLGGYDGNGLGTPVGTVESFNPATDSFSTLASLPVPVRSGAAIFQGGTIYLYLGVTQNYAPSKLQTYDIASNTWTTQTLPFTQGIYAPSATTLNGVQYLEGGEASPQQLTSYSPSANTYSTLPGSPNPHYAAGAAADNGKLFSFGGFTQPAQPNSPVTSAVDVYSPATAQWSSAAVMPTAAADFASATDGNTIYVAGGTLSVIWFSGMA